MLKFGACGTTDISSCRLTRRLKKFCRLQNTTACYNYTRLRSTRHTCLKSELRVVLAGRACCVIRASSIAIALVSNQPSFLSTRGQRRVRLFGDRLR